MPSFGTRLWQKYQPRGLQFTLFHYYPSNYCPVATLFTTFIGRCVVEDMPACRLPVASTFRFDGRIAAHKKEKKTRQQMMDARSM